MAKNSTGIRRIVITVIVFTMVISMLLYYVLTFIAQ